MQVVSFGSTGTWYADDLQLELGEAPSERNLLENGSMSIDDAFWTMGTNAICTSSGSSKFIQITGSPTDPISTDSGVGSAWQNVPIHLPATETFVMSGWAKGNAVPDNVTDSNVASGNDRNKSFGLRAIVTYSDNSASYHYAPFNSNLSDWQYVSTTIVAPEGKENLEIVNICVVCAYETNGNSMIFDDLSLVQEAAQTMKYDEDGNLVKISTTGVDPDINTYDNNGNLTKMTTGDGSKLENTYDSTFVHRLITAKDTGTGLTQTLGYDDFGNVTTTTVTSANGSKIKTVLDYSADGNRLESVTDAVGNTVRYTYNGAKSVMMGLPTSITDGKGIVTTMQYDDFGRTTQTSVANGGSVQYTYDKGMLDTISIHSQTYDFDYDVWGNMTRAEVGSWILGVYTYGDKNGQLMKQTFANDDFVSYTYDDLGRTKTVAWSDGRNLHYTYTGDGQLYSVSDSVTGKTQYYHYDGLGRLVNTYQVSTEYTEGEQPIRSDYTYNSDGRLTRREYYTPTTGKAYMTYTCDANAQNAVTNGLLTSLRMVNGQSIGYGYDSLQRLLDKGVSGGFWEQYAYAPGSQSGTTSTQVSGLTNWMGSTMLHTFTYGYDGNGNITSINDGKKGTSVAYTYDVQNQLTKAVHSNGRTETYTYDTAGNILTFSNGTTSHTYTYGDTYGWKDLLTKVDGQSITYDNSGNPISYYDGYRYTMEWTEGRKLESVTYNGQTTYYEYNHEGLRTKQTYRDGSYILYDIVDGVYVGETRYNASGSVSVYIRYILDEGNSPVGISLWYPATGGWTDYHFIKNLQGDVLEVYKASDNSLVASYTYDSWGNILSKSGSLATINPFRYRSYYFDEQTWFYYLQSRYYDPAIGRFINADVYVSTGQGVLGYNMFAYCNNNPIKYIDSSGYYPLQTAFEFLDRWLTGDGSKIEFNERDQVTKKIKKSTQMQSAISKAITQYKCGALSEKPWNLRIRYDGLCDRDTVFNMTNHSYFNLAGHRNRETAMQQELILPGRFFNPDDAENIPTGELRSVEGTPMDFRAPKAIGRDINADYEPLHLQAGYDHNWEVFCSPCAILRDPGSGREMAVSTDCPGIQFYAGNFLDEVGKGGISYGYREGIALETQFYPDSVHHPEWPQPFVKAGQHYHSETTYKFSW